MQPEIRVGKQTAEQILAGFKERGLPISDLKVLQALENVFGDKYAALLLNSYLAR